MSRSRMFGDDEPENPSPRTTIVGGQPPQPAAELPPVPTGLQRLLRLASVDAAFAGELVARRAGLAAPAGVELTPSERAILTAIPAAQLEAMIGGLPPPAEDRRTFLRQAAASAVLVLGGASLTSCRPDHRGMDAEGGAAPDVPPRDLKVRITKGAVADVPKRPDQPPPPPEPPPERPPGPPPPPAGVRPDPPPPRPGDAGADAPPRPPDNRPTRGIRPDRPMIQTAGVRPDRPQPTRGILSDLPGKKGPDDEF